MKKIFGNIVNWIKNHLPSQRRLIQLYAALLHNAYLKGYITGDIFKGVSKSICMPGLNCYSCPGAIGSCPLGTLQNSLAEGKHNYILGILGLFGLMLGRTICGFLCPMGLLQELLYKIKTPKLRKSMATKVLSYLKYFLLAVMVIIIPIGFGVAPAFCKFVCPAGIVGGAFGLLAYPGNEYFVRLNILFTWKFLLVVIFAVLCIFIFRFFCRFICPLGAIYGFFNRYSFLGITVVEDKCTNCGLCVKACKMDIRKVGDHECINCGECISVCPTSAIEWKGSRVFLHANEIGVKAKEVNIETSSNSEEIIEISQEEITSKVQKRKKTFKIVSWSIASAVLVSTLVYYNFIYEQESVKTVYDVGDNCPEVDIDIYGKDENFNIKNHKDQVTVINFWYTTCNPCCDEMPYFNELQLEFKEDMYFIAIHDRIITEDVETFLDNTWPDYVIDFGQDTEDIKYYESLGGNGAFPMSIIVDKEGVIRYRYSKELKTDQDKNEFKTNIQNLINE